MTEKRFIFHSTEIEDTLETDVDYKYTSCNKDGFQDLCEMLNELAEENEQLKERNNRQAKRLAELYELMAKKDWESLTEIIDDFCSCEEQLQRESGTYGDLE